LRRDEPAPAVATAPLAAPAAGPASRPMAAAPSGGDALLSLLAMVLSLGVVGYLAWIVFG